MLENQKSLLILSRAGSRNTILSIVRLSYIFRNDGIPERILKTWETELESTEVEVKSLSITLTQLLQQCVYSQELPTAILSPNFEDTKLAQLLDKIVDANQGEWRESSLQNTISPPKLVDFNWRVDTKMASDSLAKMSQSSLLLSLTIEDTPKQQGVMADQKTVNLELSKQELASLLDGFTKIRDQLSEINSN